jgi:predicted membrane metal-binding protein
MRVIAHMEGRATLVFTVGGSLTVLFAGILAGTFAGLIYYLLRQFVREPWLRTTAFIAICELVSWRGVHGLLPRPQLMFMTLALVYLVIIDLMGRRRESSAPVSEAVGESVQDDQR